MILLTPEEYARLTEQQEKFRAWLGRRASYREEEIPPGLHPLSTSASSLCEVYRIMHDKPQHLFAYVNEKTSQVVTWAGDVVGEAELGASYFVPCFNATRSQRRSLTMRCINGLAYTGTYYVSSGDYCRLTAKKSQ